MNRMTRTILPFFTGFLTLLVLLALYGVAFAQDGALEDVDQNAAQRIADIAFQILIPVVTIFATWAAHRLIAVIEKKFDFDIPDKQEAAIDSWVEQGVHWAEEKSRSKIKDVGMKLTGPEKLEHGAAFVLDLIESRGWVGWGQKRIESKIEAALGIHRANGGKPRLDAEDSEDLPEPGPVA